MKWLQTIRGTKQWPLLMILLASLLFSWPFWLQGKLPIPADTITGLYNPFRDVVASDYPNGTPFKNYLITDPVRQQYPWREFAIDQLKKGQIPWWNPYNFAGNPHVGNFQSAAFYPLNIIFFLMDFKIAWSLLVIAQLPLAGLLLYWFLRFKRLSREASLFSALVWMFSGPVIAWLTWNTIVHTLLWVPLILLCLEKISTSRKWYLVLLFALIAQFTAGHLQFFIIANLLQVGYFLSLLVGRNRLESLVGVFVTYLIFLLITFVPLSQAWQLANLSNRSMDQGEVLTRSDWFVPLPQLVQVVVPDYFGNPATLNYFGEFNYGEFVSFVGVIPFVFVVFALVAKKRKLGWFFAFVLIATVVLATKNSLSQIVFRTSIPLLNSSQPSRWLSLSVLSLAILSGLGLNTWQKNKDVRFSLLWIVLVITPCLIGLLAWTNSTNSLIWLGGEVNQKVALRNLLLPVLESLVLLSLSALVFSFSKLKCLKLMSKYSHYIIYPIILISTFISIRFASKFTPFSSPEYLFPSTKITQYIQSNQGESRLMTTDRQIMPPNFNLHFRIFSLEGYDPLYLASFASLLNSKEGQPTKRGFNRIVALDSPDSQIIDLLGVGYVLSFDDLNPNKFELLMREGKTKVFRNTQVWPRAFSFTPQPLSDLTRDSIKSADIIEYTPNKVVIKTTVDKASLLLLTDSWHPNWQVQVNNSKAELVNWNGLRAVLLANQGEYEVRFEYRYRYPQL